MMCCRQYIVICFLFYISMNINLLLEQITWMSGWETEKSCTRYSASFNPATLPHFFFIIIAFHFTVFLTDVTHVCVIFFLMIGI